MIDIDKLEALAKADMEYIASIDPTLALTGELRRLRMLKLIAELRKLREFVHWAHDEADNSCARRCRETGKRHKNDPWAASFDAIRTKARAAKDTAS